MRGSSNNNFGDKNSCVKIWKVNFVTTCIIIKKTYQNPIGTMQDLKINANGSKQKNVCRKSKCLHLNHMSHIYL
jgi:hypothetical protein